MPAGDSLQGQVIEAEGLIGEKHCTNVSSGLDLLTMHPHTCSQLPFSDQAQRCTCGCMRQQQM